MIEWQQYNSTNKISMFIFFFLPSTNNVAFLIVSLETNSKILDLFLL